MQGEPRLLDKVPMGLGVWGIAVLDNVVFVALQKCEVIGVYKLDDAGKLAIGNTFTVPGLDWAADMVVDTRLKRLYISDRNYNATEWPLFTVDLKAEVTPSSVRSILLDATPGGLSMTRDGLELLVVCEHKSESLRSLRFFRCVEHGAQSPPLDEVRRIPLRSTIGKFVAQAKQVADNRIVISQSHPGNKTYRIFIIDDSGTPIHEYGIEQTVPLGLNVPYSVLVDVSGLVVANDCKNERVVLLQLDQNRERLEYRGDLISKSQSISGGIFRPRRICAVEGRPGWLLVGCGTRQNHDPVPGIEKVDAGSLSVWCVS